MKIYKIFLIIILTLSTLKAQSNKEYLTSAKNNYPQMQIVQKFIDEMNLNYGFDKSYLMSVISQAKLDSKTLKRYQGRYKAGTTTATWTNYKKHTLNKQTVLLARKFKKRYLKTLKKAEKIYGVDINYIVAFIGVESKFGRFTGNYNVLDSLTTLAFNKNRMQKYFYKELKEYFLLCQERGLDIFSQKGSFAGAMGVVQQMPSIQRRYGVDFNGDGVNDPFDFEDAIGSIANFMQKNGWKKSKIVAVKTNFKGKNFSKLYCSYKSRYSLKKLRRYGLRPLRRFPDKFAYLLKLRFKDHQEIWLGSSNFRVLTTYNHSTNYGMGIYFLASMI